MEVSLKDAVMNRHSVRGFQSNQVPEAKLKEVFELAQWSPSGTNQQPWQVYVASGQTLENLRQEFIRRSKEKVPSNQDYKSKGRLADPGKHANEDARKYYTMPWVLNGRTEEPGLLSKFEMFDAPHVLFLGMHEYFSMNSAADLGMYAQT